MTASLIPALRRVSRQGQRLLGASPPGVTILAYHLVEAGTGSPVDLPLAAFRRQLEELAERAEVVPLSRAAEDLVNGEAPARDRVVLTFDDAFANFAESAWPALDQLDLPVTLFVPTDFLDGRGAAPLSGAEALPPVSWSWLADAVATGRLELGSHSRSHPDLRRLPVSGLDAELADSRQRIVERTGFDPRHFCYPRALWSGRVERSVARVYRGAVIGGGRKNRPGVSPWRLQRVSVRRDGPASPASLVRAPVVLEEWLADRARRWRR